MIKPENQGGYIVISLVIAMMSLPIIFDFSVKVIKHTGEVSKRMQIDQTRMRMGLLKTAIVRSSADVDRDNFIEPLVPVIGADTRAHLPLQINLVMLDGWDREFVYCAWDQGSANGLDATYSQNSPPVGAVAGLVSRLISSGPDGIFSTVCNDLGAVASGDDLIENIFNSDARSYYK